MTPAVLLGRIEVLRQSTQATLNALRDEILPMLPQDGDLHDGTPHPRGILAAVGYELDYAADCLEEVLDYLTPRSDEFDDQDRNCCALRALNLFVQGGGEQS